MFDELIFSVLGVSFFLLGMLAMWSIYCVKAAHLGLAQQEQQEDPPAALPPVDDYPPGHYFLPQPDDTDVIRTGYYRHEEAA